MTARAQPVGNVLLELRELRRRLKIIETHAQYPAVHGFRVSQDAVVSHTSSGNFQKVPFDTEQFDPDNMFDLSTDRATVPDDLGGIWWIGAGVTFSTNATGAQRQAKLVKDPLGTPIDLDMDRRPNPTGQPWSLETESTELLVAGDVIQVEGWQNSGGNLAYEVGRSLVWFSMIFLGR
jgi:hypothetical protein